MYKSLDIDGKVVQDKNGRTVEMKVKLCQRVRDLSARRHDSDLHTGEIEEMADGLDPALRTLRKMKPT